MKSKLGGSGVEQIMIQRFAAILNYEVMENPFVYLGMSIGGFHKRKAFWDGVVDQMKKSLSRWKGRFLSLAGRICLIKSVLSFIPLFYFFFIQNVGGDGKRACENPERFPLGVGFRGKKGSLSLLVKGVRSS